MLSFESGEDSGKMASLFCVTQEACSSVGGRQRACHPPRPCCRPQNSSSGCGIVSPQRLLVPIVKFRLVADMTVSTRREHSARCIVTSKTSLAHATVVANDDLCHFFFGHVCRNERTASAIYAPLMVICCATRTIEHTLKSDMCSNWLKSEPKTILLFLGRASVFGVVEIAL